jgi:hypothetical protein
MLENNQASIIRVIFRTSIYASTATTEVNALSFEFILPYAPIHVPNRESSC